MRKIVTASMCIATALAAMLPEESKALSAVPFTFNGTGTYLCNDGTATCVITASNFTLVFDENSGTWFNAPYATGTLTLFNPANTYTLIYDNDGSGANAANPGVFRVNAPTGTNTDTSFTISRFSDPTIDYYTFYLSATPNPVTSYHVTSFYAIGTPLFNPNNSVTPGFNTSQIALITGGTIAGQAAPVPLGVLGIIPLVRFINRRKKLRYAL